MSAVSKVPAWFTVQTQDAVQWVPAIVPLSFVWDFLIYSITYPVKGCKIYFINNIEFFNFFIKKTLLFPRF
jgi:hypothetical protein